MSYTQAITPNPNIPCQPGWCLQYVRQAYGLEARYASATEAWEKSTSQHRDRNFPPGLWIPVWYGLDKEPAGHVILRAPDGSVYSTSDLGNTPHHHADLADLEAYYAYYGMTLTYRGWTEDVASYTVINNTGLAAQGTIQKEDELSAAEVKIITDAIAEVKNVTQNTWAGIWSGGSYNGKSYAYGALPIIVEMQRRQAVDNAQIKNLISALAAVAKGEPLDEAKLLAGIQASAEAGVKAGIADGTVDVNVTVGGVPA